MKFIREIPVTNTTGEQVHQLHQWGFTLIYTGSTIELWA